MSLANPKTQRLLAIVGLVLALALIGVGLGISHKVYLPEDDFGMLTYQRVGERALVEDATFGGATLRNGKLFTTYDRSKPRGKVACPT